MDREKLIEQAEVFAYSYISEESSPRKAHIACMADFAIEQLAVVTAERDELKATLNEFALEVIGQYGDVIGNQFRTGGESTIKYAFRILGWDDPHSIEGETDNG